MGGRRGQKDKREQVKEKGIRRRKKRIAPRKKAESTSYASNDFKRFIWGETVTQRG